MKDFYVIAFIDENIMDKNLLKTAIHKTMKNRNTQLKKYPSPLNNLK